VYTCDQVLSYLSQFVVVEKAVVEEKKGSVDAPAPGMKLLNKKTLDAEADALWGSVTKTKGKGARKAAEKQKAAEAVKVRPGSGERVEGCAAAEAVTCVVVGFVSTLMLATRHSVQTGPCGSHAASTLFSLLPAAQTLPKVLPLDTLKTFHELGVEPPATNEDVAKTIAAVEAKKKEFEEKRDKAAAEPPSEDEPEPEAEAPAEPAPDAEGDKVGGVGGGLPTC
jgi:hypothetical protein